MRFSDYITALPLADAPPLASTERRTRDARATPATTPLPIQAAAVVNAGAVFSFVDGVPEDVREDILYSVQFAQRAASAAHDRFNEIPAWYRRYTEILETLGWAGDQLAFSAHRQNHADFRIDEAALAAITAIATQHQLTAITRSIEALSSLADDHGAIGILDAQASGELGGNFQLGAVQRGSSDLYSMALGAFYFRAADRKQRFLFFRWSSVELNLWTAVQRMTFNRLLYAAAREPIRQRLGKDATRLVVEVPLQAVN